MDPVQQASLAHLVNIIKGVKVYTYAIYSIMVWDWLVNLHREYKLIWKKPRSVLSILYVALRYLSLILITICIVSFSVSWTVEACDRYHRFQPTAFSILQLLSQLPFIYHAWKMTNHHKLVTFSLSFLFVIETAIMGVGITHFHAYRLPHEANDGCISGSGTEIKPIVLLFFVAPLVFHTAHAVLITHYCWQNFRTYSHVPLKEFLLAFQIPFYAVVFICHLVNAVTYLQASNPTLRPLNSFLTVIGTVVMTCRTILSLKSDRLSPFYSARTRTRFIPGSGPEQPLPTHFIQNPRKPNITFLDPSKFNAAPTATVPRSPTFGGKFFDFESKVDFAAGKRPQTAGVPFRNLRSAKGAPGSFGGIQIEMTRVETSAEVLDESDVTVKADRMSLEIELADRK